MNQTPYPHHPALLIADIWRYVDMAYSIHSRRPGSIVNI